MRRLILGGTLVLASMLTQSAMADWKYQFNSDDSLSWRIAGHALKLHSDNTTGITVTKIGADPVWGLQKGDVIVAVDDYPVKHVSQLMDRLRAGSPSSVKLHVRRGAESSVLTVTAAEYGQVVSPTAPVPLKPSAPSAPSVPATSPVMESGWYTYEHDTDDSLSWRIPDHVLKLQSDNTTGITVTKISPDALWGLRQGDVITAVDNHPVKHVNELMAQLRASRPVAVKLNVRRGNAMPVITVAAADYSRIVSPGQPASPSK
ncbi:PDZ domain-containing protein [Rhodanobacter sp. A1T4]|uniref:PDZ domain-containing protein n=1 Tax=Rhodanobacter sp. A1T4 TaxID=2723087 RepID=UPI0016183B6F|nr:PDZ domain-containing protein [Rhodanobacter sp. A1T4]MBB6245386.1 C-terminal processing protease CtpA/Prc [Rhodanobacter sp. A1T4]